jgi:hypothetical protein
MQLAKRIFIIALVGLLLGSSAVADVNEDRASKLGVPLPYWRLEAVAQSSIFMPPTQVVIQSNADLRLVWDQLWQGIPQPPSMPSIDFKREAIVVFALGSRGSGGYGVRIGRLMYSQNSLEIMVETKSPGKDCFVTAAVAAPVDVVRIDIPQKPPNFRIRSDTVDCSTSEKP